MTTHYASETFLHQLLGKALAAGAADVHLKVGQPPGARVRGDLVFFRVDEIEPEDTEAAARVMMRSPEARVEHDAVFAYDSPAVGRFRVSAFRQRGALSLVMRHIPHAIPTASSLGVPANAVALVDKPRGLVVLAGGPSSGRSTTAAALVGHVNEARLCHVVTFEDPIEHVHADRRASVAQRAVGADVASLAAGLRAALRQDADLLFAADLATAEELDAALHAAERSLVLVVLDAPDVPRAIFRLAAMVRPLDDGAVRLASALQGVVAQRLVPKRDGTGVALSARVLALDARLRDALRRAPQADAERELARMLADYAFEPLDEGPKPR